MIYLRTDIGRLGNQLFVYAFAVATQKGIRQNYILSHWGSLRYFKLVPFEKLVNWTKAQFFFRFSRFSNKPVRFDFTDLSIIHDWRKEITGKNNLVIGYFQSEHYFKEVAQLIKSRFSVRRKYYKIFDKKFKDLFKHHTIVVVHVRRTDYRDHFIAHLGHTDYRLPLVYYKEAVKRVDSVNNLYILIGDDREYLENEFRFIKNKIVSYENEITDFLLLIHADACILSNSTFAWWGAYLNTNFKKRIIVPKYFLGFKNAQEYPAHILPEDWEKVDIEVCESL